MRVIAISDIHGHAATFKELIEEQIILSKQDKLFLLGDYVHRGPDYEGVLDYILKLQEEGYQVETLFGNHEFIWFDELRQKGKTVPPKYKSLMTNLKFYIEYDNFIFVHAGLKFGIEDPFSDKFEMVWIRNWYNSIDVDWLAGRRIIHGHTPQREKEIRYQVESNHRAIGIDNGCFVTRLKGMGQLCALDLTNMELYFQENIDEKKWRLNP